MTDDPHSVGGVAEWGAGGGLPSLGDPPSLDLSALRDCGEQDVSICWLIDILREAFVLFGGGAVGGNGNYPLPRGTIPIISYSK